MSGEFDPGFGLTSGWRYKVHPFEPWEEIADYAEHTAESLAKDRVRLVNGWRQERCTEGHRASLGEVRKQLASHLVIEPKEQVGD